MLYRTTRFASFFLRLPNGAACSREQTQCSSRPQLIIDAQWPIFVGLIKELPCAALAWSKKRCSIKREVFVAWHLYLPRCIPSEVLFQHTTVLSIGHTYISTSALNPTVINHLSWECLHGIEELLAENRVSEGKRKHICTVLYAEIQGTSRQYGQ